MSIFVIFEINIKRLKKIINPKISTNLYFLFTLFLIKCYLYDKIISMKVRIEKNIKIILILALAVVMVLSTVAFLLSKKASAYADSSISSIETELFLPKTELEYKELISPKDAYSDDSVTAIIESNQTTQTVEIYYNNTFTELTGTYDSSDNFNNFTALGQVKKFNENTLLISNQAKISAINLGEEIKATELSVSGTFFDTNSRYLIITFEDQAFIYSLENGTFTMDSNKTIHNVKGNAPIAINDKGDIFYVSIQGFLYKTDEDRKIEQNLIKVTPDVMAANDTDLFYIYDNDIYRLPISGNHEPQLLTVLGDTDYQLGNIFNAESLSFKDGNLLIADTTLNAVQEFKIEGDKLVYTGFAIAKDKTAYNRIDKNADKIEKYGNKTATLDTNKLSIVTVDKNFDAYNKTNFKDYFQVNLGGEMPTDFALGNNTVLLVYKHNSSLSQLRLLSLDKNEDYLGETVKVFDGNIIRDICYQSGKYYVLANDGSNTCKVFVSSENVLDFGECLLQTNYAVTQITVDVFNNIYLLNEAQNIICKYTSGTYDAFTTIPYNGTLKNLSTDLGGALFSLIDNKVCFLNAQNAWQEINISPASINVSANIKSFAMDFISKDVYLIYENEEFIYKTSNLNNFAISTLNIPQTYVTTASSTTFEALKVYKTVESANVYAINKTDTSFEFKSLVDTSCEYALISEINQTDAFGRELKLFALAGQDGVVLTYQNQCEAVSIQTANAPEQAFTTTAVHLYYLPISTADDGYALTNPDKIRLSKNTKITPQKSFDFLGISYYLATVELDGVSYTGYIPKNFTVELLSENVDWNRYVEKTVNETDLFADKEMTQLLGVLKQGQKVRIIEQFDEVYKIAYKVNDQDWAIGYISNSCIQDVANVAIRNTLVIVAVAMCVCGTTAFFILKRKK